MSLISEKWQPSCLAGNLKSIRCKRDLTPALVKFSLKRSYFHFVLLVINSVKPQIISWFRSPLNSWYGSYLIFEKVAYMRIKIPC